MPGTNRRKRPVFRSSQGWAAKQPSLIVTDGDLLPEDHVVRQISELTEDLFGEELRADSNLAGGFGYDPVVLTCVWMYAFMQGELSSRRVEEKCIYDMRYQFLARCCKPDHTTLSRFRKTLGERLDDLMLRFCVAAGDLGILQRRTMVVDGTKTAAFRSQWARARKKSDEIDDLEAEAVTMLAPSGFLVGYNVQAAADADSGLLVGYVVTSKPQDSSQLAEVCKAVKRQSGGLSERVVADKGYDSSANAMALDELNVEGYLPARQRAKPPPFSLTEEGEMVCAAGHIASKHAWTDKRRDNKLYDVYRVSKCTKCPLSEQCPGKGRQRQMKALSADQSLEKQKANRRCLTEEGKSLMRIRGQTIERPFAVIKGRFRLKRFQLRGIQNAGKEFGLAVLAFNLQTLMRFIAAVRAT